MTLCGVEISIARGAEEMARAISWLVLPFLFHFIFLYHIFIVKVEELKCRTSYGITKTLISKKPLNKRKLTNASPNCIRYTTHCQLTVHKCKV